MTVFPIKDSDKFPPNEKYIFAFLKLILKRDIMIHIGTPSRKEIFWQKRTAPPWIGHAAAEEKSWCKEKNTENQHTIDALG